MDNRPRHDKGKRGGRNWLRRAKLILAIILVVLLLIFIWQNSAAVPFQFLFFPTRSTPLSLLMVSAFAAGVIAGVVLAHAWRRKS